MSATGSARRPAKRRARYGGDDKEVINVDALPSAPARRHAASATSHGSPSNPGCRNPVMIDVEAIDDEVQVLSPPAPTQIPRERIQTRSRQLNVVILEDTEADATDEVTYIGTRSKRRNVEVSKGAASNNTSSHRQASYDQNMNRFKGKPAPTTVATPKEPSLTCPVCLSKLVEPASTICGHIFCSSCIKASVQAQKKCPTCRRKLRANNFHRIYLPETD